jgi:hypothetical protein
MKLFKKLKAYDEKEKEGAILGFGLVKAMDYDKEKKGRLALLSMNLKKVQFIKKLFIPNIWH